MNLPITPRGWQLPAIDAITKLLGAGGRAQVHAACGTGKTWVALSAAVKTCPPDAVVVVACPSLGLLGQTLRVWTAASPAAVLAACSDDTVVDAAARLADLPFTVTTDPVHIGAWLGEHPRGRRLIGTTHLSAPLVGQALTTAGIRADLLIVDEAHHAAGDPHKHVGQVHDDLKFPAARRLYLTATPQWFVTGEQRLSMHDETIFGPVAFQYSFAQAIADGWIDDYRLLIVAVTRREALALLKRAIAASGDAGMSLHHAVISAALARAADEYGLRRDIVYHPRRALSRQFASALAPTLAVLDTQRPGMPLFAAHVQGTDNTARRDFLLQQLAEPPGGGWAVLSNARCLSEGIDIPAIDTVVFTAPKHSATDTVQAIGRALRRGPSGPATATILVPVLVTDEPAYADGDAEDAGYTTVWNVIRGLRSHDDLFGAMLDSARERQATGGTIDLPEQIQFRLPDTYDIEAYLNHIRPLLIQATTSDWWEGYGHAGDYYRANGDLFCQTSHVNAAGFRLGVWLAAQRSSYHKNQLHPRRSRLLDTLGMCWRLRDLRWEQALSYARRFRDEHGHLRIPNEFRAADGFRLGAWLNSQRQYHRRGNLGGQRAARLTDLGIEWWPYEQNWERGIAAMAAFAATHGHTRIGQNHVTADGFRLGAFLWAQRTLRQSGRLSDHQIAALDALGISWQPRRDHLAHMLTHAADYVGQHGNLSVPMAHRAPDGCLLGAFVARWSAATPGQTVTVETLTAAVTRAVTATQARDEMWNRGLEAAQDFHARHGHLRPTADQRINGINVSAWLYKQRSDHARRSLSPDHAAALDALGIDWSVRQSRSRPATLAAPSPPDEPAV